MARIHILHDAISDGGTYSGGSWVASLPLTHLVNAQPRKVARSTDATTASTRFVVDLNRVAPVSMFALIGHNLSVAATMRIRASNTADGSSPLIDETIAVESNIVWGTEAWGAFPWNGLSTEELESVRFYKHETAVNARYVLIDITDTGNLDGYVEIGRFLAGDAFVPAVNMAYGAQLSFIDETRQSRTIGGQLYSDVKPLRRRFSCAFDALTEGEALGAVYSMQRQLGIAGSLLVVYDPDDAEEVLPRRTIYGRLADMAPLVTANASTHPYQWTITVEELI